MVSEKRCTRCGETKLTTEFYRDRRSKNGLESRCKACCSELYRIYLENGGREKKAEIFQRGKEGWYADYVEKNRERIRANSRRHYHKNHPGARTYKGSAGIED